MSSMVGSTLGLSLSGSSLAFLSVLARVHLLAFFPERDAGQQISTAIEDCIRQEPHEP